VNQTGPYLFLELDGNRRGPRRQAKPHVNPSLPRSDFLPRTTRTGRGAAAQRVHARRRNLTHAKGKNRPRNRATGRARSNQFRFRSSETPFLFLFPLCSVNFPYRSREEKKRGTDFPLGLWGWVTYDDAIPFVPPAPGRDRRQAEAASCGSGAGAARARPYFSMCL